ncbi:MAG: class I SAM-dependent methyltransferase [Cupriavidus sp.]|nr:class I SAM-dependent methyltransferase [Cupriavidus sp.]
MSTAPVSTAVDQTSSFWPAETLLRLRETHDSPQIVALAEILNNFAAEGLAAVFSSTGVMDPTRIWPSAEALLGALGVAESFMPLAHSCLYVLARHGYLEMPPNGICRATGKPYGDMAANADHFAHEQPRCAAHIRLTALCVTSILAVLRGQRAPTEVFFGEGLTYMEGVFRDNPNADFHNALCAAFVSQWLSTRLETPGSHAPIAILEMGAGTGGTTTAVLPILDPHCASISYDYTDVSVRFRRIGRKQFGEGRPWLNFGLFDMERDALAQGYNANSFDLIVASNVLHASRDIGRVLRNVRQLLKPGGVLLLSEMTAFMSYTSVTFGLLEGWWAFEDPARRIPFTPLLDPDAWCRALTEHGFSRIEVADGGTPGCAQSVIAATWGRND